MAKTISICLLGDAAAQHLRRWALFFADRGHDVSVITLNRNVLPGYAGVKLHVVEKPFKGSSLFSRAMAAPAVVASVRRILRSIRPDLVHSHSACGYAWLGMWSGIRPHMVSPWGTDVLEEIKESRISRFLTVRALRGAALVHTDGANVRSELLSLGVEPGRILLAGFGVDVKRFCPAKDKEALKATLGVGGRFIALSTRTLTPVHDVGSILRAVAKVRAAVPSALFVIVGDGPERARLQKVAEADILAGSVRFVGSVEEDAMANYLRAADVFVSASIHESGLSASTAEAMSCALPVVNTDSGDIRSWVADGVNGYVVPVGDSAAIAARIIDIAASPAASAAIGDRNRAAIMQLCNRDIEMGKIERSYRLLADGIDPRAG